MDLQLQIDIGGDVTKTTLAAFLAENAELTEGQLVTDLRIDGIAIIGGGAAPVVRITALTDPDAYVEHQIDLYHLGWDAARNGEARPADPVMAEGWDARFAAAKVTVIMPARAEGYFHQNPNGEL